MPTWSPLTSFFPHPAVSQRWICWQLLWFQSIHSCRQCDAVRKLQNRLVSVSVMINQMCWSAKKEKKESIAENVHLENFSLGYKVRNITVMFSPELVIISWLFSRNVKGLFHPTVTQTKSLFLPSTDFLLLSLPSRCLRKYAINHCAAERQQHNSHHHNTDNGYFLFFQIDFNIIFTTVFRSPCLTATSRGDIR